ncbi:hypothetical protein C7B80_03310 [Cyanosarcina cf. burmensis CCALA 770]|nr:hypothetical protein C7B80_03310 [Cyanosarcina cf. burmensis CCALA 770]
MFFHRVIRQVLTWLHIIRQPNFFTKIVPQHPTPEEVKPRQMLIVGEAGERKWVCFRCPGGCGETILLSLNQSRHPCWTISTDWLGRATIYPSIKQLNDCRCHFWIRQGNVEWCPDSGEK